MKHVCDPKTTGASDKGENKVPSVADFRKYEEAARYGLTVSEKANIDSNSLSELKNKYGNVLGSYNTYQGTGYFNPQGSPINRYIISRYEELKAIEDDKVAQKVAEMNKYHYTNLYEHIAETGYRIDGTPASDIEKAIAPYVPWIEPIQDVTAVIAGRQVAKYNSSVPTGNGKRWSSNETVQAPKADVVTTKPKSGDVPVTRSRMDVTPVQQLALPGPTSKPLALPAPKTTAKSDFYVAPDGRTLPSTSYRYMDSKYAEQTMRTMEAPGSYIGLSKFDLASKVQDAYQISPAWNNAKLRGEFDTLQIMDNVYVPKEAGDTGKVLESITSYYPEYGKGDYPQLKTNSIIEFKKVDIIGD